MTAEECGDNPSVSSSVRKSNRKTTRKRFHWMCPLTYYNSFKDVLAWTKTGLDMSLGFPHYFYQYVYYW